MSKPTTGADFTASFDQPVPGALYVKLDNGKEWAFTKEDLSKFGLANPHAIYRVFRVNLELILRAGGVLADGQDLTDSVLNPLRELVEVACFYPEELERSDFAATREQIVALEQAVLRDRARVAEQGPKCGDPDNCTCTHGCDIP